MTSGLAQSVMTRLPRHARAVDVDPNLVFARYATERLLYRLSKSDSGGRFVLKGALLLVVWLGETIRPTRDADLLGFGALASDELAALFAGICAVPVEPDGLVFDVPSIRVAAIRAEDAYGGQRITLPEKVHGYLPGRALSLALEWSRLHRPELLEDWRRARAGEPLVRISPLE